MSNLQLVHTNDTTIASDVALRELAARTAAKWQRAYLETGKVLYEVHVRKSETTGELVWKSWGYTSFYEYVEEELKIPQKSAQRMQRIFFRLNSPEDPLYNASQESKDRLLSIGFAKVSLLMEVVTDTTLDSWVAHASKLSCEALRQLMGAAKDQAFAAQRKQVSEGEDPFQKPASLRVSLKKPISAGEAKEEESTAETEIKSTLLQEVVPVAVPERKFIHFSLYPDQYDSVQEALKQASQISESDKQSHNLTLICDDFVMTNRLGKVNDQDTFFRYLEKIQRHFGVKLVAVDPNTHDVIYGMDTLYAAVAMLEKIGAAKAALKEEDDGGSEG